MKRLQSDVRIMLPKRAAVRIWIEQPVLTVGRPSTIVHPPDPERWTRLKGLISPLVSQLRVLGYIATVSHSWQRLKN